MSNHDYIIANAVGATVRADINDALAAIATNNSSATEPATMYAYQWWADTTAGVMKQRNAANTAWLTKFILSEDGTGTFTATGTGFATPPTATATYKIMNGMCFINIPQSGISGTSNAVTFTITGMPVAARPSAIRYAQVILGTNNGATTLNVYMQIATDGTMTLGVGGDPSGWVASGTKGLYTTTIVYML